MRAGCAEQHQLVRSAVHHVEERLHAHCSVTLEIYNMLEYEKLVTIKYLSIESHLPEDAQSKHKCPKKADYF